MDYATNTPTVLTDLAVDLLSLLPSHAGVSHSVP